MKLSISKHWSWRWQRHIGCWSGCVLVTECGGRQHNRCYGWRCRGLHVESTHRRIIAKHCNALWLVTLWLWWPHKCSSIRALIVYFVCLQQMIREGSLSNLHESRSHFASPAGTASGGWYLRVDWGYLRTYGRYLRAVRPGGVYVIINK